MEDLNTRDVGKVRAHVGGGLAQGEGVAGCRVDSADDGLTGLGELGLSGDIDVIIACASCQIGSRAARVLDECIAARTTEDGGEGVCAGIKTDGRGGGEFENLNAADLGKVGTRVSSSLAQCERIPRSRVGAADN